MKTIATILFTTLFLITNADAKIYKWVDEQGKTHYTQTPPPAKAEQKSLSPNIRQATRNKKRTPDAVNSKYCNAIKEFAIEITRAMRRGAPASAINSATIEANEKLKHTLGTREPIIKQVVSFVYGFKNTGMSSFKISELAYGQCMNGAYGSDQSERKKGQNSGSAGTGWVIEGGFVVTNHHVVNDSQNITLILSDSTQLKATVKLKDEYNDIVVLTVDAPHLLPPPIPLSNSSAGLGVEIFTIGFPHPDLMGSKPKLTTGHISATSGMRDDPRMYQISVALQSGNSGGPLLNLYGEAIGIVTAKLNAAKIYETTGDLTQNVNYAIKIEYLHRLLTNNIYSPTASNQPLNRESSLSFLAIEIEPSILMVIAH